MRNLRESVSIAGRDAFLSNILLSTSEAIISIEADRRIILFNNVAEQIFGYTEDEVLGKSIELLIPPAFRAKHVGHVQTFANVATKSRLMNERSEIAGYRKDGETFPAEASITKSEIDGRMIFTVILRDVTERKQIEEALRERASQASYRQLAELSPDGMLVHVDGEIVFANASLARILAVPSPEDLLGTQAIELIAPEYRAYVSSFRARVMAGKDLVLEQFEFVRSDGSQVPVEGSASRISWQGNPAFLVLFRDITERVETERVVTESRDQIRLVTDNLPCLIAYMDAETRYRFANKTASEWHARPVEEIVGKSIAELLGEEYEKIRPQVVRTLDGEQLTYFDRITYPDGVTRAVQATHVPHFGATGTVQGYFSLVEDISELQQAEQALRQAQKMEVVGQLTGGVAHDFNNLLAITMSNAQLLELQLKGRDDLLELTSSIVKSAQRGAELTHRLLAFSRKQTLQPENIQIVSLCEGMSDLLRCSLGETIEIEILADDEIWKVRADAGQVENALLNLAINASHAMARGGKLTIAIENALVTSEKWTLSWEGRVGEYVALKVIDTGAEYRKMRSSMSSNRFTRPRRSAKVAASASAWCMASRSNPAASLR